jgi:3-mercaptopyruvate sulfurtransferase SseA
MELAVPCTGIPVLVYDDESRQAARAATTFEGMGYRQAMVWAGGLKQWVGLTYPTEWSLQASGELLGADLTEADCDSKAAADFDG